MPCLVVGCFWYVRWLFVIVIVVVLLVVFVFGLDIVIVRWLLFVIAFVVHVFLSVS